MEEQRDVIHGGVIMKSVIQNAKLKQCSRYVLYTGRVRHTAVPPTVYVAYSCNSEVIYITYIYQH